MEEVSQGLRVEPAHIFQANFEAFNFTNYVYLSIYLELALMHIHLQILQVKGIGRNPSPP